MSPSRKILHLSSSILRYSTVLDIFLLYCMFKVRPKESDEYKHYVCTWSWHPLNRESFPVFCIICLYHFYSLQQRGVDHCFFPKNALILLNFTLGRLRQMNSWIHQRLWWIEQLLYSDDALSQHYLLPLPDCQPERVTEHSRYHCFHYSDVGQGSCSWAVVV